MDTIAPKLREILAKGQPWVRRLLERDPSDTAWGYGIYYLPTVVQGANSLEEVQEKQYRLLDFAKVAVGCVERHQMPAFCLQPLQWPIASSTTTESATAQEHFIERLNAQTLVPKPPDNPNAIQRFNRSRVYAYDADTALLDTFKQLRIDFRQVRATRPAWHFSKYNQAVEGLHKGLLDNIFLVVDEHSAWSWWNIMPVDYAWVWAVDPDFDDSAVPAAGDGTSEVYKGYVKVRLQQLVNNFFEAREYQAQISLQTLWEAARQSTNCAFVSQDARDYCTTVGETHLGSVLAPKITT